jgi:hypothetical protein
MRKPWKARPKLTTLDGSRELSRIFVAVMLTITETLNVSLA